MSDVVVEHGQHHVRSRLICSDAEDRCAHGCTDRIIRRVPPRDHARSQVAVGDDPEVAIAQLDKDVAGLLGAHPSRRLPQSAVGLADDRRTANQRLGVLPRDLGARRLRRPIPGLRTPPGEQGAGQEPQARGTAEKWDDVLSGKRVDQRVLSGANLVSGGLSGERGRVTEHLAFAQKVDHAAMVHELDRTTADHADSPLGTLALGQDGGAARKNSISVRLASRSSSACSSPMNGSYPARNSAMSCIRL